MNKIDRYKILVRHIISNGLASSQKDLGNKMGYTNESAFSQIINEKVPTPKDFSDKLKTLLPDLNLGWLDSGVGDMFTNEKKDNDTSDFISETELVCDYKYTYVSSEIVQQRNLSIKNLVKNNPDKLIEKSLIELLGGGTIDYVQRVMTSAMSPLFMPGDLLFIRFLPDDASIISGAIYLLDTKNYGAMVRQVYVDEGTYTLHALNNDYHETIVKKDEIYSFGLVVRMIRSDFNVITSDKAHKDTFDMMGKLIDEVIEQNRRNDNLIKKITEK